MSIDRIVHHIRLRVAVFALLASVLIATPARAADTIVTTCDEVGFTNALNAIQSDPAPEGTIVFDCGPFTKTIDLSLPKLINGRITIDGGGKVVLSGMRSTRLFEVRSDASLMLRNIIIEKGLSGASLGGAIAVNRNAALFLFNSTIRQSDSQYSGGAIHSDQGSVYIESSMLEDNTADYGGAIAQNGGTLVISATRLIGNRARVGDGGGVESWFANNTFTRLELISNIATADSGGGMSLRGGTARMQSVVADSNTAQINGGGLYIWEGGQIIADDLLLSKNSAAQNGGGLYIAGSTLTLARSKLHSNTAAQSGGGIATDNSQSQISDTTLLSNQALISGGGILHIRGTLDMTRSIVQQNSAPNGEGGGIRSASALTLTNVLLNQNSAAQNGGALRVIGGTARLINTTITNNAGNGISARQVLDGIILLRNSVLARNVPANCNGGAQTVGDGYNLADDSSCALAGSNDQNGASVPFEIVEVLFNTIALNVPVPQPTSPALNSIPASQCPPDDLRGLARPQGSACDAGALERPQTVTPVPPVYRVLLPLLVR